ncbi:MAG TPA: 4-hydroxy-tetrahydrodipicolinate reductase [Vicinamibacterales bacterium]|nr:4-hydroxy-tetrahydrodipicolinate reductase [Vicinamibacterales bacterium]
MIHVSVAGATGWVGRPLCLAIQNCDDLRLAAAVARSRSGERVGDISISGSVEEALRIPSDVFVDFTHPDAAKAHALMALSAKRHVVIGTSGLTDQDFEEIGSVALARGLGVVAVGNFALSAVLLQRFAAEAAKHLLSWEIVDYASDAKVDAPSGTARELAWRLAQVSAPETTVPIDQTVGARESRGTTLNGSQVHSVRLPGYTIGVEVRFGGTGERLTIACEGGVEADPYIVGTLLAIRRVAEVRGLLRGLDPFL